MPPRLGENVAPSVAGLAWETALTGMSERTPSWGQGTLPLGARDGGASGAIAMRLFVLVEVDQDTPQLEDLFLDPVLGTNEKTGAEHGKYSVAPVLCATVWHLGQYKLEYPDHSFRETHAKIPKVKELHVGDFGNHSERIARSPHRSRCRHISPAFHTQCTECKMCIVHELAPSSLHLGGPAPVGGVPPPVVLPPRRHSQAAHWPG
eukprot:scaffold164774_cov32-Tisochrysis_lutea.AAC.2